MTCIRYDEKGNIIITNDFPGPLNKDKDETDRRSASAMLFSLSKKQYNKLNKWKKGLPPFNSGAVGGAYVYSFIPTALGTIIKVTRGDGENIDLTEEFN